MPVHERDRLQGVAQVLGHLAAVLGEDVAEADDVLVRRLVEDQRADRHQRVEPAAGLVDGLADELRRVAGLEQFLVLVRVAPLRERHRTRVVPGVDDLGHARGRAAAAVLRAGEGDLVDERPVRVKVRLVRAGQLGELREGADAGEVVVLAAPDRQRGAPVAVAGQRPVDVVVQPVAVPAVLDRVREPVGVLVLREEAVLERRGADVPGGLRVVEQRGVAAPAVRVAVLVRDVPEEQAALVEIGGELLVGLLEEDAADQGDVLLEGAVRADRVHDRQAVGAADLEVVLTEGGGLVDQTRTVLGRDVVGVDDEVRGLGAVTIGSLADARELHQLERPLVGPALHLGAREGLAGGLPALAEGLGDQRLGDDELLLAVGGDDVGDLGVGGDRRVGDQRPGRGRPDQERGLAGQRAGGEREAHVDRRVDDRLVALRQLVVRQARAAAGAPGGDAVVLGQQPLAEDLLERPPDRLDVLGVHGAVGLGEVGPVAHAGGERLEGVRVPGHRLAALRVELRDAVGLDVLLAGEAELLLDGQLHREAVAVPAGLAGHVVAAHGAEAGEDVLEDAGLDVVGAGHAVGGGRALVEHPLGASLGLFQALGEDLLLAPEVEHGVLQGGQVDLGGYLAVRRRCHQRASSGGLAAFRPEGRELCLCLRRLRRAPAVPPSLALRRGVCVGEPPHWGRDAGSTRRGARLRLSSGGSGVIFTSRSPPGSHRPRVALGCVRRYSSPSTLFAAASVRRRAGSGRPLFGAAGGGGACGSEWKVAFG